MIEDRISKYIADMVSCHAACAAITTCTIACREAHLTASTAAQFIREYLAQIDSAQESKEISGQVLSLLMNERRPHNSDVN